MVKRSETHKIGDLGEQRVRSIFAEAGYAVSGISPDYGEDFFVFGEDGGVIEPFKIYVQVKASKKEDKYNSDWTVYEDCSTVKNWVMGGNLTVLVRFNQVSGLCKFCIPEDEFEYWELLFLNDRNVSMMCGEDFDIDAAHRLMWVARIRQYDRLLKIAQPNEIDGNALDDTPKHKFLCLDLLHRLQLIDIGDLKLKDEIYVKVFNSSQCMLEDYEDSYDMSATDKAIYASCTLIMLNQLELISGYKVGASKFFIDSCACIIFELFLDKNV